MADESTLELGTSDELDVNSESGFMAAIAKTLGKEIPAGTEFPVGTDVASGLTFGDEPREEETPEGTPATPDGQEEVTPESQVDPDVAAYLERYGGDTEKALKAAAELNSAYGRQGNELGELRQAQARLEGQLEVLSRTQAQPVQPAPQPVTQAEVEFVDQLAVDRGGYAAVVWALQNRPQLYERALDAWAEISGSDARKAAEFNIRYQQEYAAEMQKIQAARNPQQPVTPEPDANAAWVQEQRELDSMAAVIDKVGASIPNWENVQPFMEQALEYVPKGIVAAVLGQSKELSQEEAVAQVAVVARQLQTESLRQTVTAEEAKQRRASAQVVTGSGRPVVTPQSKPASEMTEDERIAAFKQSILKGEDTSVAAGLTFGK